MDFSNIDYIFFDLDGTIIDSNDFQNNLDVELEHLFDKKITKSKIIKERNEFLKKTKGIDIYLNYCGFIKKKYGLKLTKKEILEKRRELERVKAVDIKLKKNAEKLIKLLKEQGIHLALATVSRREILNIYMNDNKNINKKINLSDYFDIVLTKEDVKYKKPNPEVYLNIIEKLNIKDTSKCLVVEDSLSGIKAAKSAGLKVIGIYDKYSSKDEEEIIKLTDYYAKDYEDLINLFKMKGINEEKNMISPCVFRKRDSKRKLAFIEITNSCNMKCKHCMNWSVEGSEEGFTKEEIIKLLDELHELDTEEIYISGGEPLLYPYIDEAILHANELGIKVTLATNGLEIRNHLEVIKKGVQLVSMSFDGIGKTHDKMRGTPGAFDNCVNMFKLLKENNVKVRISAMIWKDNLKQIEEMISLAKNSGVSKVNLAYLIPEERVKNNEEILIPNKQYKSIAEDVTKLREKYKSDDFDIELRRINHLDENSIDCPGGRNLLHINVHGKVSPCSWLAKVDKDNEFSDMWPEKSLKECIKKFDNLEKVKEERKAKFGYCGCIAIAQIYNGDFLSEDPLNSLLEGTK